MEYILTTANIHKRFIAFMKDIMTLVLISVLLLIFTVFLGKYTKPGTINFGLLNIFIPVTFLLFAKDSIKGKSLGKSVTGIMVRDKDDFNKTPSFIKLFVRNIFLIVLPVEILFLLFRQDKRRLGDIVTNTIVLTKGIPMTKAEIIESQNPANATNKKITIIVIACIFLLVFCIAEVLIQKSDAYLTAIEYIENNREIQNQTSGIKRFGLITTGSFSESVCEGTANFKIRVIGKKKSGWYTVYLQKKNCVWEVIDIQ